MNPVSGFRPFLCSTPVGPSCFTRILEFAVYRKEGPVVSARRAKAVRGYRVYRVSAGNVVQTGPRCRASGWQGTPPAASDQVVGSQHTSRAPCRMAEIHPGAARLDMRAGGSAVRDRRVGRRGMVPLLPDYASLSFLQACDLFDDLVQCHTLPTFLACCFQ